MIDASATIEALTATIDTTHLAFAEADYGLPIALAGEARKSMLVNVAPRLEIVDARAVLTSLKDASTKYLTKWSTSKVTLDAWLTSYETTFVLLDRHGRYVTSLTTTPPSALAFASDEATHAALVTRADTAAASGAPSAALTDLARYRSRFDTTWAQKPTNAVGVGADASAEGVALTAALSAATQCIAFLTWAQANPS